MTAWVRIGAGRIIRWIAAWGLLAAGSFAIAGRADPGDTKPATGSVSVASPFAKGPLENLDLANKRLTLRIGDGPRTFTYTDRTYMFSGKDRITADKLATGEIVAVRIAAGSEGSNLVVRLKVYPVAPPSVPAARPEGGAP